MKIRSLLAAAAIAVAAIAPAVSAAAGNDDVVRILAVGNSFSEDALDYYFHGLCGCGKECDSG